jgi:hypothetical protein
MKRSPPRAAPRATISITAVSHRRRNDRLGVVLEQQAADGRRHVATTSTARATRSAGRRRAACARERRARSAPPTRAEVPEHRRQRADVERHVEGQPRRRPARSSHGASERCAELLIGRNSARPCMTPSTNGLEDGHRRRELIVVHAARGPRRAPRTAPRSRHAEAGARVGGGAPLMARHRAGRAGSRPPRRHGVHVADGHRKPVSPSAPPPAARRHVARDHRHAARQRLERAEAERLARLGSRKRSAPRAAARPRRSCPGSARPLTPSARASSSAPRGRDRRRPSRAPPAPPRSHAREVRTTSARASPGGSWRRA